MDETVSFLLIDDDALVLEVVELIIKKNFPTATIDSAKSIDDALSKIEGHKYNLVLLDLSLQNQSGLTIIRQMRLSDTTTPILVLSASQEDKMALSVFRAGANGFVCKDQAVANGQLLQAIRTILSGSKFLSDSFSEKLIEESKLVADTPLAKLSAQESKVFLGIARGLTVKEISFRMILNEKTVRTYRARLLEKLGLNSDASVMRYAIQNGLIELDE